MMGQKIFGKLFLSIGAMKAGTTWLYRVLARHPELHFTFEKELHYFYHKYVNDRHLSEKRRLLNAKAEYLLFDTKTVDINRVRLKLHWVAKYLQSPVDDFWYRNLFDLRDSENWRCDFSNLHAFVPEVAWPQISAECEQLRVLYTMRHPLKRLWSNTLFHLQTTGGVENLDDWAPKDFENLVRLPHIWVNAEYGAVLRRLRTGLKPEERMVIFYENLHADQSGTLVEIEQFLGVEPFKYPKPLLQRRFVKSANLPMPEFFQDLFSDDIERIKREVAAEGYELPDSWG